MVSKKNTPQQKKQPEKKVAQLELGLKSPFKNVFYNLKGRLVSRFNLFEANTFINDPLVWLLVTSQLVGIFYQLIYVLNSLNKLPSLLPFLGYEAVTSASLLPKIYFLIFPIVSFVIFAITFRNSKINYFRNQFLSIYILLIGDLIILSLSLHIIKVLSQYV